jgi:hypothetical protein
MDNDLGVASETRVSLVLLNSTIGAVLAAKKPGPFTLNSFEV